MGVVSPRGGTREPRFFPLASSPLVRHRFAPKALVFPTRTMPTYEYECTTCGHQFEAVQSMKDPKLTDCPQEGCPGPVERKLGKGAGIIFKGSGFYITDYRSESYKAAAKKDSDSGGSSAPSTSSSSGSGTGGSTSSSSAGSSGSGSAASSSSGSGSAASSSKVA